MSLEYEITHNNKNTSMSMSMSMYKHINTKLNTDHISGFHQMMILDDLCGKANDLSMALIVFSCRQQHIFLDTEHNMYIKLSQTFNKVCVFNNVLDGSIRSLLVPNHIYL